MDTIILGRTGLRVTTAGLGGGGFSRLGVASHGEEHAAKIVRAAYDSGVTFFDTAMMYGTEAAVGRGLRGIPRDMYVISTKLTFTDREGKILSAEAAMDCLDNSLKRLETDYVDIYHLHAVLAENYREAAETLVPMLIKAREQGKLRFPGITEQFVADTTHEMLPIALADDFFDVIMVGYSMINQSANESVLPLTMKNSIGTLCMFAVRTALHNPEMLKNCIEHILENGQGDAELLRRDGTLEFLTESGVAGSIMEAAYRFCRHTPGIDVTLTGTKNPEHLADNLQSINMPPLPQETLSRLEKMFAGVNCVSGQ